MTTDVTVREVRLEEHKAVGALTLAAYRALLGQDMDERYAAELADVAARARHAEVLVAVDGGGGLVGAITYIPGPGPSAWFDGPDEAGMRMLAVAPSAQGRGVGARLVAACTERATVAGRARLVLRTTAAMTVAHRLYERAGFRREPDGDRVLEGGLVLLAYALDLGGKVVHARPGGGIGQTRRA